MVDPGGDEDRCVAPCVADAARKVTRIGVGPNLIGIMEFRRIMDEVREMGPMDDEQTRWHLLKRTKAFNYVPPNAEDAYADAMLEEFRKIHGEGQEVQARPG
jgi:hypothetical protein